MNQDIQTYHESLAENDKQVCDLLHTQIVAGLPGSTNKVWHGHPVWFLDGNPIVGYAKRKNDIQLLFWSGQSFDEPNLAVEGSFKAAQARYTEASQINTEDLKRWLKKASAIQWDYKHIVKNRGHLDRLN